MLTDKVKAQIKQHAVENPKEEVCGLVVQNELVVRCKNVAQDKENSFLIHPEESNQINQNTPVVAFYHSHIANEEINEADKAVCERTNTPSIIYIVKNDSFKIIEPHGYEVPYLNRPYLVSILDCFTLVKDYYHREFNINIPYINHPVLFTGTDWYKHEDNKKENNFFVDFFKNHGFSEVTDLKKNDILLMSYGRVKCPVHVAIYLGNNIILHQRAFDFSRTEIYQDNLKRRTVAILRHENFK